MANRQLVLAVFPDELAADSAAAALKDSGIADGDAIGILVLDADGKLKQDKVGAHSTGKGAACTGGCAARFASGAVGPTGRNRPGRRFCRDVQRDRLEDGDAAHRNAAVSVGRRT